jgi:UDP-N-acetylglucosamine--N-acetylmuramyl-(pentapeptide) pyrophosphoryl-undecaprenol N-acetylglucosamine transferase
VLLNKGHCVYLFISKKRPKDISLGGFNFFETNSLGWDRTIIGGIKSLWSLNLDFISTLRKLKDIRPNIVVGIGGYASVTPVIGAVFLGIPRALHEQNIIPGLANRLLAPFVDRIFISFPQTIDYFLNEKVIYTGLPLRDEFYNISSESSKNTKRPTFIVMGGSQGARIINEVILEILERRLVDDVEFIHITGIKEFVRLRDRISNITYPFYRVYDYKEDIWNLYREADVAISRAGASSVTELATVKLPAILIPYEGAGGHQLYNAKWLKESGGAIVLKQSELSASALASLILEIANTDKLSQMKKAITNLAVPKASYVLAEEILKLL